jgi:hypothetical protein
MLRKIKALSESKLMKGLLIFIILSFVGSMSSLFKFERNRDLVTFNGLDSISERDFVEERNIQISQIQTEQGESLSDQQLAEVNQRVLKDLISKRLFSKLSLIYDVRFSNKVIAETIRNMDIFQNNYGIFDINIFTAFLNNKKISHEKYADILNKDLSRGVILNNFIGSYTSNMRIQNIINHLSETRNVQIGYINLSTNDDKILYKSAADDDLKGFYEENLDLFKIDESRDVNYAIIDLKNISQYENVEVALVDITNKITDEIAAGASFDEVIRNFDLKKHSVKNLSTNNIELKSDGLLLNVASQIADMNEGEISYPLDLPNLRQKIIIEVTSITPEHTESFETVRSDVLKQYNIYSYKQSLLAKAQEIIASQKTDEISGLLIKYIGPKNYSRIGINDLEFPQEMLSSMFLSERQKLTGPFIDGDKAYFFIVNAIYHDKNIIAKASQKQKSLLKEQISDGTFEEIVLYLQNESKMKIKTPQ